jgi:hypothetical protein
MKLDVSGWSGEGTFTQQMIDWLQQRDDVEIIRVEDAPASRSEADYNFISNEIFVAFATEPRQESVKWLGFLPGTRIVDAKRMTIAGLGEALGKTPEIGEPDYADDGLIQYLRTERIVPPYQTKGYKLVELVRLYEVGAERRS